MREFLDEILARQFGWTLTYFPRANYDEPLHHECRFRAASAAIGIDRHCIGVDRVDLAIDLRDLVLARQQRGVEISRYRRRKRRHISAEIGNRLGAQAENLALAVERHLGMGDVIAAMRIGYERFRALGYPFHRPADALGRPKRHDFFWIDENLRAEAATDIRRDDSQLMFRRHADEGGDHEARDMRILRRIPQCESAGAGVVVADRRARLDRVRNEAIVDDIELSHMLGRVE